MRLTTHNAKTGNNGVFLANHNDRNFDYSNSEHIDAELTKNNTYWHCYKDENADLTFRDVELKFYEETFSNGLNERNQRYLKERHPERVKDINALYENPKTCPEESLFMIGNAEQSIPEDLLLNIYKEFSEWRKNKFPNIKVLNYALHVDEEGAPHIHERFTWISHDKNGNPMPSTNKALEEMGINLPKPNKPKSKYNNRKQEYSRITRQKIFEICKNHNLDLITTPKESSHSGLELLEYKRQQETQRSKNLQHSIKKKQARESKLINNINSAKDELEVLQRQVQVNRQLLKKQEAALDDLHTAETNILNTIKSAELQKFADINKNRERRARDSIKSFDKNYSEYEEDR